MGHPDDQHSATEATQRLQKILEGAFGSPRTRLKGISARFLLDFGARPRIASNDRAGSPGRFVAPQPAGRALNHFQ